MKRSIYRTRAGRTVSVFLTVFLDVIIDGRSERAQDRISMTPLRPDPGMPEKKGTPPPPPRRWEAR